MRPARSLSSATVVAVIVLIGGWSNVTWQYLGLRRSTLKCVQDRDHISESRVLSDGPVSIVFMSNSKVVFEVMSPITNTSYSFILALTEGLRCAACLVWRLLRASSRPVA